MICGDISGNKFIPTDRYYKVDWHFECSSTFQRLTKVSSIVKRIEKIGDLVLDTVNFVLLLINMY